jgi:hypothetical protein
MPPVRPAAARRRVSWEAIGGITAVAALVASVVFGILQVATAPEDSPPAASALPADERLELVEVEFDTRPAEVTVLEELFPGAVPSVSPNPRASVPPGASTVRRVPLLVTLRNPSGDTAVLTGVKLVVHETGEAQVCGKPTGGGVSASLNYDFRFPTNEDQPWSRVNPQNFAVAPGAVEALSVTMGPMNSGELLTVWRFSVYGVSKGGREAHWADGVAVEGPPRADGFGEYIWPSPRNPAEVGQVRACAAAAADRLQVMIDAPASVTRVVHPDVQPLLAAYRTAAAS